MKSSKLSLFVSFYNGKLQKKSAMFAISLATRDSDQSSYNWISQDRLALKPVSPLRDRTYQQKQRAPRRM